MVKCDWINKPPQDQNYFAKQSTLANKYVDDVYPLGKDRHGEL